jgi:hypothetical protein
VEKDLGTKYEHCIGVKCSIFPKQILNQNTVANYVTIIRATKRTIINIYSLQNIMLGEAHPMLIKYPHCTNAVVVIHISIYRVIIGTRRIALNPTTNRYI